MLVLRKTMDAAVEAQRRIGADAVMSLAKSYGEALNRVTALHQQLSAWVTNKPEHITPRQFAQMFYAQADEWQAEFFNCMQEEVRAVHASMPPRGPYEMPVPHPGVPPGEGQWFYMAQHLNESGRETLSVMHNHAVAATDAALSKALEPAGDA
jgi:plasmid maintenance system antidote protein VapI